MPHPDRPLWLRRHQNPLGIALRALTGAMLGAGLWWHHLPLVAIALAVEWLNWVAMPPDDDPPGWLIAVIRRELVWLDAPWGGPKLVLVATLGLGLTVLALGLWTHAAPLLVLGALMLAVAGVAINVGHP